MDTTTHRETVYNLYELLARGAFDEYVSNYTQNALWIEPEGSIFGGKYRGREEIRELLKTAMEEWWLEFNVDVDRMLEDDGTVVVLTTTEGVYADTGKRMETRAAHVYDFEDGLIHRMESFEDTVALHRAIDDTP
jgi:ketosteroid isomerase-like protein